MEISEDIELFMLPYFKQGLDVGAIRIVAIASAVLNSMENPSAKQSYKSELNVSYRKEGLNMLLTAYVPVTQVLYVDWFNTIEGQMGQFIITFITFFSLLQSQNIEVFTKLQAIYSLFSRWVKKVSF